jgi:predicted MFS family arabinose efflux permease
MTRAELRAAASLALVFFLRMLGLFMITPVFPLYAEHLDGATPTLVGLAVGVYGLTQALLQIPFGMASDRLGRKKIITAGLLVFVAGSAVAALSQHIAGVAIGRALQGAGAVGSATMALAADVTREETRIKAMAIIGMTIGLAFPIAFVAGPALSHWLGAASVFWMAGGLGLGAIAVLLLLVPQPAQSTYHRDVSMNVSDLGSVLRDPELMRIYLGVFALHTSLQALFLVLPLDLRDALGIDPAHHWHIYLPALALSVVALGPLFGLSGRRGRMKEVYCGSVLATGASALALGFAGSSTALTVLLLTIFFAGFNFLEASQPSLVSQLAPAARRGTALGPYSAFQFIGISLGGAVGGWLHGHHGKTAVFVFCGLVSFAWLAFALTMKPPRKLANRMFQVGATTAAAADALAARLRGIAGVTEATVVAEDGVAYLKVDPARLDGAALDALLAGARA